MEPQVAPPELPYKLGSLTLMYVKCIVEAIALTGVALLVTHLVLRWIGVSG